MDSISTGAFVTRTCTARTRGLRGEGQRPATSIMSESRISTLSVVLPRSSGSRTLAIWRLIPVGAGSFFTEECEQATARPSTARVERILITNLFIGNPSPWFWMTSNFRSKKRLRQGNLIQFC
ncbi:MAG: hypothetical protein A2X97_01155 [Bdellovibrionales bacterium GWA1_52_35]|nr:MAG: hypothetical protein A2X97_01155 [Bdellovibrionales bacterium GWA1_52_35]